MLLTNLADVVRRSGLTVIEEPGWKTRGHGEFKSVEAIICHHTGTPASLAGDYPTLKTVRDGRPGLDGPLAQLGLQRSGTVRVIAAGVAWHAGVVFETWQDNWHAIGIEAEDDGVGPWNPAMYAAYVRLVRALRDGYAVPNARVMGHKEIAKPLGRKVDPTFDMSNFRAAVAALKPGTTTPPVTTPPKDGFVATEADRVIAHIDATQKGVEAGRYADLKRTMTEWAEAKDNAREKVILDAIAANTKAINDLAAAVKAKGI